MGCNNSASTSFNKEAISGPFLNLNIPKKKIHNIENIKLMEKKI
jgi:hypothetical protein